VHGIACEALAIYAMVAQHMPIKAVVVPHLLDFGVLKKLFEDSKHLFASFLQERVKKFHTEKGNATWIAQCRMQQHLVSDETVGPAKALAASYTACGGSHCPKRKQNTHGLPSLSGIRLVYTCLMQIYSTSACAQAYISIDSPRCHPASCPPTTDPGMERSHQQQNCRPHSRRYHHR